MENFNLKLEMFIDEKWWGGSVEDGINMPFGENTVIKCELQYGGNQTMPMYLSNFGRCIWSEEPFTIEFNNGKITADGSREIVVKEYGKTLKDAYVGAMNDFFKPTGNAPEKEFFRLPQYNTWMQLVYDQTQDGVMAYAKGLLEHGFKAGIVMIDEGWQTAYGEWTFNKTKFPNPKRMIDELHGMGFKVMLWVVPYVVSSGKAFITRAFKYLDPDYANNFLRTEDGEVAIVRWWNGFSAMLDMTKENDRQFMKKQLDALMTEYGVDGFKFDGGTITSYSLSENENVKPSSEHTATERNIAWNEFGSQYAFHEYKDTFKGGGKRTIQRIRDRLHSWNDEGINTLIPNAIAQGIIGHPFICPDMVGGGEWLIKQYDKKIDQELFVRMAQCSALFPMIQFSWAPYEAVDEYHFSLIKKAHDLHVEFGDIMVKLVDDAVKDGQPILRSLEYNYPNCGYADINDEFMLGEEILVAPVVVKGEKVKKVTLPQGKWKGCNGTVYQGEQVVSLPVTIEDLPYFIKIND